MPRKAFSYNHIDLCCCHWKVIAPVVVTDVPDFLLSSRVALRESYFVVFRKCVCVTKLASDQWHEVYTDFL